VSVSSPQTTGDAPARESVLAAPPSRRRWRRALVLLLLAAVLAAVVVVVVGNPFAGGAGSRPGGTSDNTYPTSIQTVSEQSISSQTQASGTLGYAGDTTIRVPSGTAPSAVTQAQQAVTTDETMLANERSALASDRTALAQARATLSAEQQREAVDCAGDNAAAAGGGGGTGGSSGSSCASDAQLLSTDQSSVTMAAGKVSSDESQIASTERQLASARGSVASARAQETFYGQGATYTSLGPAGKIVHRGGELYAIDGQPVLLLYGRVVATRAFVAGMSPGADVAELNANLDALGVGHGLSGDAFTAATAAAIRALQARHGLSATGELLLGSVVFEPGAQRVTAVSPQAGVGATVTPGPLLTTSSTARVVSIALDTSLEGEVSVGDPVIITLPDSSTTPGRVSYISPVASSGGGGGGPTFTVDVVPDDPGATGTLDQASVNVAITTQSVAHALVVPVNALLALAGGGYAVEEVSARGVHHLVPVTTGLFDDADGLVAVSGAGLAAGQRVVVPGA
jgi:peptidoglycan hydrolase-like protein with peptidoglycan-binding domain